MTRPAPPSPWAHLPFFTTHWPALWDRLAAAPAWAPHPDRLFRALSLTPPDATRVVILGQDILTAQILNHLATTAPRAFLLWGAPAHDHHSRPDQGL
jgi:uracil DNA glycosylase